MAHDWRRYQVPEIPDQDFRPWEIATKEKKVPTHKERKISLFPFSPGFDSETAEGRGIEAGTFKVLRHWDKNVIMMSDTNSEIRDMYPLFDKILERPGCSVLIHGLGLGVAVKGCFLNGASKVVVIEKDPQLIAVVGKFWMDTYEGLEVREGDAFTWKPMKGERWDWIWHDIWPSIDSDNLPEMGKLHRRFYRRCDWQECWRHDHVRRLRREDQRMSYRYWY